MMTHHVCANRVHGRMQIHTLHNPRTEHSDWTGRTFYGPTPSTDNINTFRALNWVIAIGMWRDSELGITKKCFWTKSPTLPSRLINGAYTVYCSVLTMNDKWNRIVMTKQISDLTMNSCQYFPVYYCNIKMTKFTS